MEQRVLRENEGDGRIGLADGDDHRRRRPESLAETADAGRDRQAQRAGRVQGIERFERERSVAIVLRRSHGHRSTTKCGTTTSSITAHTARQVGSFNVEQQGHV